MCKIIVKSFAGVVFAYILAIFKEYCANILYLKGIMIVILLKEAVMIRNRYSFLLEDLKRLLVISLQDFKSANNGETSRFLLVVFLISI